MTKYLPVTSAFCISGSIYQFHVVSFVLLSVDTKVVAEMTWSEMHAFDSPHKFQFLCKFPHLLTVLCSLTEDCSVKLLHQLAVIVICYLLDFCGYSYTKSNNLNLS
jgi:hypothetical protein